MYDELVKRLRESKNEQCYIGCFGNCGDCKIDAELEQAADAIEELTDRNVGKWIPVTERLPEERDNYLVLTEELEIYVCDFIPSLNQWWTVPGDTFLIDVTHWMPLPQPPKEET